MATPNAGISITLNPVSLSRSTPVDFLIGLLLILIACFSSLIPF
jgi:hypothetical protein